VYGVASQTKEEPQRFLVFWWRFDHECGKYGVGKADEVQAFELPTNRVAQAVHSVLWECRASGM
jgi:hypothetical protein